MDASINNVHSIYYYLKQNLKFAKTNSDLIPYIEILPKLEHLKQFLIISLDKQYQIAKTNQLSLTSSFQTNKLHLLFLSLHSKHNNKNHKNDSYEPHLENIRSEPTLSHSINIKKKHYEQKSFDIDKLPSYKPLISPSLNTSNADSNDDENYDDDEDEEDDDDDDDVSDDESEHGVDFAVNGHGPTTIIYTDTEQPDNDDNNSFDDMDDMDDMDEIKESMSSEYISDAVTVDSENNDNPINQQKQQSQSFQAVTKMREIGEKEGITIKSQFGYIYSQNQSILMLSVQILNMNVNKMDISEIKIRFNKNYVGITSTETETNICLPSQIKYNQGFGFNVPLKLDENQVIEGGKQLDFNNNVNVIINTNLFGIECNLEIPIYLFFEQKQEIQRDTFLNLWKSTPTEKEYKLQIIKCKCDDIENLKKLLSMDVYQMNFIHHRIIPNKGNILYYSSKMNGIVLLIEIAIALTNKGSINVRSNDKFKSILCANAIRLIIDTF